MMSRQNALGARRKLRIKSHTSGAAGNLPVFKKAKLDEVLSPETTQLGVLRRYFRIGCFSANGEPTAGIMVTAARAPVVTERRVRCFIAHPRCRRGVT